MIVRAGDDRVEIVRPSRAEIEGLCIVHVVSGSGCSLGDLAEGLGLSRDLAPAIEDAIAPLIAVGRLEMRGDLVVPTEVGRTWLRDRLSELSAL